MKARNTLPAVALALVIAFAPTRAPAATFTHSLDRSWPAYRFRSGATGIAARASGGVLIAASGRVYVVGRGNLIEHAWSGSKSGLGAMTRTDGIAEARDGGAFVADAVRRRIVRFAADGRPLLAFGGSGTSAGRFGDGPMRIAVDRAGTVYVTDPGNGRLQAFSSAGRLRTTYRSPGAADGWRGPLDVDVDVDGAVWVLEHRDGEAYRVAMIAGPDAGQRAVNVAATRAEPRAFAIDRGGVLAVEEFAGAGDLRRISAEGRALSVPTIDIPSPSDIDYGPNGDIYVAHRSAAGVAVARYDSEGGMRDAWGWRGPGSGQFDAPSGVALLRDGLLAVTDSGNDRVRLLTGGGFSATLTAGGTMRRPGGVAPAPDGGLVVADTGNARVLRMSVAGAVLGTIHAAGLGVRDPRHVAVDPVTGRILLSDTDGARVLVLDTDGSVVRTIGTRGSDAGQLLGPTALAVRGSRVYVADAGNRRIAVFTTGGAPIGAISADPTRADGRLGDPKGVAVDGYGRVYVADATTRTIKRFDARGTYTGTVAGFGEARSTIVDVAMTATSDGRIFVSDTGAHAVRGYRRK